MTTTEKRVGLASGNWGSSGSNFEVESSQVYRQEKVNLVARKSGQKDLNRPKSEEDSSCTRKLDASSPELENMRFSDLQYMENIPMHTDETGKNFDTCHVLSGILQNQCLDMVNVHGIVDESRHSSWARFLKEFGNLQEHKIPRECVQHHSKNE